MTPEEWQRVRPILESALDLDLASRASFLDQACADASLRREVESLIASHEQADPNILNPVSLSNIDLEEETRYRLPAGKRIGAYEILEEIGMGGMGAIYRAIRADGEYRQQVALKVVRAELGVEFTAARFKKERRFRSLKTFLNPSDPAPRSSSFWPIPILSTAICWKSMATRQRRWSIAGGATRSSRKW